MIVLNFLSDGKSLLYLVCYVSLRKNWLGQALLAQLSSFGDSILKAKYAKKNFGSTVCSLKYVPKKSIYDKKKLKHTVLQKKFQG